MSEIEGAHLLIATPAAVYETPPFVRTWRMRGPGGPTRSSQAGEVDHEAITAAGTSSQPPTALGAVEHDTDSVTGSGSQPPTPGGEVVHRAVALAGAVT